MTTTCAVNPKPLSCLALHGLGGGPFEFGSLLGALRAEGLRVAAPVLPGHEGPGPKMPPSRWEDWSATAEQAFDELNAHGDPVAVLGFSTGGTLALRLATNRPVARLALLAPFLAIRYSGLVPLRPVSYLQQLARVVPDLPRRPPPIRDPAMRKWAGEQDRFTTFSLPATVSALKLIELVKPFVPTITTPSLILQGRLDTVVEPANASWLHRHLGSAEKGLEWFDPSDHLLALDRERDRVIDTATAFILGQVQPAFDPKASRSL